MKKFFASIAAVLLASVMTQASAQAMFGNSSNDYRIGIQLGGNAPSFADSEFDKTIGWNFGATALLNTENFIPNSYLRGSVLYTRLGASCDKPQLTKGVVGTNALFHLHYLQVPIHFGYAYDLGNDFCILAETGPGFGMRVGNTLRIDNPVTLERTLVDIDEYGIGDWKPYEDLRRFDVNWGLHAGFCYDQKYQVMLGYDWGLCDIVPDVVGANRNLSLNLVVYFD